LEKSFSWSEPVVTMQKGGKKTQNNKGGGERGSRQQKLAKMRRREKSVKEFNLNNKTGDSFPRAKKSTTTD